MELEQGLIEIAKAAGGLEIKPAGKRGEVIINFPRRGREPLSLRLSRIKAVELILWLYLNTKPRPTDMDPLIGGEL